MKKSALFAALLGSALLLGACGDSDKKDEPEKEVETEETEKNPDQPAAIDKSDSAKSDDDMKEEFAKEEGVSSVSIIVTEDAGGYVLVDFEVAANMEEKQAQKLADQFAKTLKEKYADHKIDVQARKNGETFAQNAQD